MIQLTIRNRKQVGQVVQFHAEESEYFSLASLSAALILRALVETFGRVAVCGVYFKWFARTLSQIGVPGRIETWGSHQELALYHVSLKSMRVPVIAFQWPHNDTGPRIIPVAESDLTGNEFLLDRLFEIVAGDLSSEEESIELAKTFGAHWGPSETQRDLGSLMLDSAYDSRFWKSLDLFANEIKGILEIVKL